MYKILPECVLREVGDKFVLIIFSQEMSPRAMEVNESFARLFRRAQELGTFEEADLAAYLVADYGLAPDFAKEEAGATIRLWLEKCLIA